MEHLNDPSMHGTISHMLIMWGALGIIIVGLGYALFVLTRQVRPDALQPIGPLAGRSVHQWPQFDIGSHSDEPETVSPVDTVFVLPDISRYTRFMTGSQFSVGHAQHIILSLLNAIISAAHGRLELSKLEGDAALFFVDGNKLAPDELGEAVMEIFRSFFRERRRLRESNICPCRACSHIDDLDLKIFVHRGEASRFQFRGAVDLFGTDVIVIHRIMKNSVDHHRYVMITDVAASAIAFPEPGETSKIEETVEHIGLVGATAIKLSDDLASRLSQEIGDSQAPSPSPSLSVVGETVRKLRFNVGSLINSVGDRKRNRSQSDVT